MYDLIIIGGGPAGSTLAYLLKDSGLKIRIIDKENFPREKVCGDGLGYDTLNQLRKMPGEIFSEFLKQGSKQKSSGIRIFSPNSIEYYLKFPENGDNTILGYTMPRKNFDNFLLNQALKNSETEIGTPEKFLKYEYKSDCIEITTDKAVYKSKILVGADGANSLVRKQFSPYFKENQWNVPSLRTYYKNVKGIDSENSTELHFTKETLPGYFWIFPEKDGICNVGLGIHPSTVKMKKLDIKQIFNDIVTNHPTISPRFKDAEQLEPLKGAILPISQKKASISGNRILFIGDAASLVDPLTGEGVANAIRLGRFAADHVRDCFKLQKFDAQQNSKFDERTYNHVWRELRLNEKALKIIKTPWILNTLIKKLNKDKKLDFLLKESMTNLDLKQKITGIRFLLRLLFR